MTKFDMGVFFRTHFLLTRGHKHHKHLCFSQMKALIFLIKSKKALTISDIKNHLKLAKSSTTAMVDVLSDKGLIVRKTDKKDKRKTIIELTEQGTKVAKKAMKDMHATVAQNMEKLDEEDIKKLKSVQHILADICQKLEQN